MARAKGSRVWTQDGRCLLDFTSGVAVTNLGHCHPRVVAAAQEQIATLVHGNAVENAIKLARHATGKPNIIVFQGGNHGWTVGAVSLTTSTSIYRTGFGPLMGGVTVVPFPFSVHGSIFEPEAMGEWCLSQLRLALKQQTASSETAAILIEPVLGEGGHVVPPKSFMQGLRQICAENDILLIADEAQCGFGRTGEYFAIDGHFGISPDILVMAKGIANGFPLSGLASRKELTDKLPPGSMGGTYAGNAVGCAAAIATQEVIKDENVIENTRLRGKQFLSGLERLKISGRYPILDVRGIGLMVAMEFDLGKVPTGAAFRIAQACLQHGMMVLTASVFEILRFMPPLTISEDETAIGLVLLEKALDDVFGVDTEDV